LEKYIINGGKPLHGSVTINGAKNAAVAIVTAAVMVKGVCVIENVPKVSDVTIHLEILRRLGAKVTMLTDTTVEIDSTHVRSSKALFDDLMRKTRASYYFLGALLARFGKAQVCMPGGCDFGVRPIDQHIKGFQALGAEITVKNGAIHADGVGKMKGTHLYFDINTVGATMNMLLASVLTPGQTVLENAAKEPHIVDLANFLNSLGADIRGAGTDVIKINGVRQLHGGTYSIIPDQIEACTFMAAVAATGGEIRIDNVIPKHLECINAKYYEMGVEVEDLGDSVLVRRVKPLTRTNVKTLPYPGFPTDMHPQTAAVLCLAQGTSLVVESVWQNRFRYVEELKRMGAKIQVDGQLAVIEGVSQLTGAAVHACDLRAGAALVIAALAANGTSEITGIENIERGYDCFVKKLQGLGADIESRMEPDGEEHPMEA